MSSENPTTFELPTTGKFCCIGVQTNISNAFSAPVNISPNFYAFFKAPLKIDEFWTEDLGKFQANTFSESNLLLFAFAQPDFPDTYLDRLVTMRYYSLLVQGAGYSEDGLKLAGPCLPNGLHVSSVTTLHSFNRPHPAWTVSIDEEILSRTNEITNGLVQVYSNEEKEDYLRLRKGFDAFLRGVMENRADTRIHQFVRALEAVIKPERGTTERQFIHRCQIFAGRTEEERIILTDIYRLRSAAEHMNPLSNQLTSYSSHEHPKIIALRTFQAEVLAGHVYQRVLSEDALRQVFISEASVTDFWRRPDDERISIWGNPLNLKGVSEERFYEPGLNL
jgi:hypothetical protein